MLILLVKDATGKLHQIEANNYDTLSEVKHKVCIQVKNQATKAQLGDFANSIRLEFNGKSLNDNIIVSDIQVKNYDTLYMKSSMLAGADNVKVTVTDLAGEEYEITIASDAKISALKDEVYKHNKVEVHTYDFTFNGENLLGSKTLQYYNIVTGNTLQFMPVPDIQLDIIDFDGRKCWIYLEKQLSKS